MSNQNPQVLPGHPGDFLKLWLMPAQSLDAQSLSSKTGIPEATVIAIMDGNEDITQDIAGKLVSVFGHAAETMYRMQTEYDIYKDEGRIASSQELPVLNP